MHIAPFNNQNQPIVDIDDTTVPLNYFNIVKLTKGQSFDYQVPGYETCIVPATGSLDIEVEGMRFSALGNRGVDVWDGEPEGVYIPSGAKATFTCVSESTETFVAGAKYDKVLAPFAVLKDDIDLVQYGSDDTKTHRKIKHILGQKQHDKVGRLLVSELFTVGAGGWSGFHRISTTQTVCQMKPVMMKPITFASGPTMDRVCKCCKGSITSPAMPIILWMDQPSALTTAITPARPCRDMRCITLPFWEG